MHDRRAHLRARTALRGRIVPLGGGDGIPCVVRDLSAAGAQVEVPGEAGLAVEVSLVLGAAAYGEPARVVWRSGPRAGIAFLTLRTGPPVLDDAAPPPAAQEPDDPRPPGRRGWLSRLRLPGGAGRARSP